MGLECGMWAQCLECELAMGMGGCHMGPVGNAAMGMGSVTWAPRSECDGLHDENGGRGAG
jgi:hypothetical protein